MAGSGGRDALRGSAADGRIGRRRRRGRRARSRAAAGTSSSVPSRRPRRRLVEALWVCHASRGLWRWWSSPTSEVDQGGSWFHLADSMAVRDAFQFHGTDETWHLQVDALPHPQHLDQGMVTEGHSKVIHSEPSCEMLTHQVEVEVGKEEPLTAKGERSSSRTDPKGSEETEATSTEQRACERKRLRPRTRVGKTPITEAANSSGSSESEEMDINTVDAPPSQFVVMLKECHFVTKNGQYLNVPREFSVAHGYAERKKVLLRMGGESWTVNLKHCRGKARTSFRYGWHQFCIDNHLRVGETCFFRALDRHVLKVEVRRLDGSYAS